MGADILAKIGAAAQGPPAAPAVLSAPTFARAGEGGGALLAAGPEATLAQSPGQFAQFGANLRNVGTFFRENPGGALMAATNNLGLGEAGSFLFKDTDFDPANAIEGLTDEELESTRKAITDFATGAVGAAFAGGGGGRGQSQGQAQAFTPAPPAQAPAAPRRPFVDQGQPAASALEALGASPGAAPAQVAFGGGGSEAELATGRPVRPALGTSQSQSRQSPVPQFLIDEAQRDRFDTAAAVAAGPDQPFTDLRGPFGGQRIGQGPLESAAANTIEGVRRRFLGDEASAPEATSGVARFFTELVRSRVPGGELLPQRPTFQFQDISQEQLDSPEGQEFLRQTENNPMARAAAFASDSRSLSALMSLPNQAFQQIFPQSTGFTLGGSRFMETPAGAFSPGSVRQTVDRRPNQTLIGTGEGRIAAGRQVSLQDEDQIRELVNSGDAIQLAPGVDPNERLRLFDRGTNKEVMLTRAQLAVATRDPEIQQRLFGDPGTLVGGTVGGKRVELSRSAASELSQLPADHPARFEPDAPRDPSTSINVNVDRSTGRQRGVQNVGFISGLNLGARVLRDLRSGKLGKRSTGRIGKIAEFVSGTARLFSDEGGQFFLDLIAGGKDIDAAKFAAHRQELNSFAVGAMEAILGQPEGARVSDADVRIARESVGVLSTDSDPEKVKGAIMALTGIRIVKNTLNMAKAGRASNFPVGSREESEKTFNDFIERFEFTPDQAEALTRRLIELDQQLETIDFDLGKPIGGIRSGSFGIPDPVFERP